MQAQPGKRIGGLLAPVRVIPLIAADILGRVREELAHMFLERGDLIDGALSALLARQHVLIIGPPGTAKSVSARTSQTWSFRE